MNARTVSVEKNKWNFLYTVCQTELGLKKEGTSI